MITFAFVLLPDLLGSISAGSRHVLLYSFFKVGPLAITPLFLIKAGDLFLFLLVTVSHRGSAGGVEPAVAAA